MGIIQDIESSLELKLVICGGGHVAKELAALAAFMDYKTTVIEERAEYISKERFPEAELINESYTDALRGFCDPDIYYVIVTPGHKKDIECLRAILNKKYAYLGMIGSRGKVKICLDTMRDEGVSDERLSTVHAPIGIPISSETPKEIAVSIIAEIIKTRNCDMPKYSVDNETLEKLKRERGRFVCARITAKRGSTPRGKGACIFICESGSILGTVGGGKWEADVIADAKAILNGQSDIKNKTYVSEEIGVICGGEMDIEFKQFL